VRIILRQVINITPENPGGVAFSLPVGLGASRADQPLSNQASASDLLTSWKVPEPNRGPTTSGVRSLIRLHQRPIHRFHLLTKTSLCVTRAQVRWHSGWQLASAPVGPANQQKRVVLSTPHKNPSQVAKVHKNAQKLASASPLRLPDTGCQTQPNIGGYSKLASLRQFPAKAIAVVHLCVTCPPSTPQKTPVCVTRRPHWRPCPGLGDHIKLDCLETNETP
jgi:hypothetical protein